MNIEARYGGVALGVEAALPTPRVLRPLGRAKRLLLWLVAALRRWA